MAYWEASTYHREDGGNAHLVATFTASDIPLSEIDLLDLLDGRLPRRGRGIKGGAQRLKVVSQNKSNLPGQIEYYLAEYERRDLRPGPMRVRRAFLAEQTYAEDVLSELAPAARFSAMDMAVPVVGSEPDRISTPRELLGQTTEPAVGLLLELEHEFGPEVVAYLASLPGGVWVLISGAAAWGGRIVLKPSLASIGEACDLAIRRRLGLPDQSRTREAEED